MSDYIRSPLNYTGGKYKLLSQIIPRFPNEFFTFVDLFGGGGSVFCNINADNIIYNDISYPVAELLEYFYKHSYESCLEEITQLIDKHNLSKHNKQEYFELRNYYNTGNKSPIILYTLICYSFNNIVRFNSKGEFNVPFGEREFSSASKSVLKNFITKISKQNIIFQNKDFSDFDFSSITSDDFVYADPPYLNSAATYNNEWNENKEIQLLSLLDELDSRNVKFALSNNLNYKNEILNKWKNKYFVSSLDISYHNCCYTKKNTDKNSGEILITNYEPKEIKTEKVFKLF